MNYNKLKCLRFSHGFYFSKLVFLNYILPLNISFGVIRLIFKECHIHGGVEPFCDGRWTLIYLMIWRVPRKIHSIVLGSSLLWCCWGMWTKAKQSNTFMEEMSWVLGYDLRKTLHDVWKLKTWPGRHSIDEIDYNKYNFSTKILWDMGEEHKGPCNF